MANGLHRYIMLRYNNTKSFNVYNTKKEITLEKNFLLFPRNVNHFVKKAKVVKIFNSTYAN